MLAGYLPFDDDPANPEGDNINLLYKYIVNTPLTFPEYVTPHARDLLRRILVPNPRKRADLFEVARHSWLSEYAHVVEFITSSTTTSGEIQNTTVPAEDDPPTVARSSSVREASNRKTTSAAPAIGGLTSKQGTVDPEAEAAAHAKQQRDNKRRTVQVEYVAPNTQTQRGEPATAPAASSSKTKARSGSQGPVEVQTDKALPRDPPGREQYAPISSRRPPSAHLNHVANQAVKPASRSSREGVRATSDGNYMTPAAGAGGRPNTGGSNNSMSLGSGRATYAQPSAPMVADANVHGRIQQPAVDRSNSNYEAPGHAQSQSQDFGGRASVNSKYSKNYPGETDSTDSKGHRRSNTIGEIGGKIFGRSGSLFGSRSRKSTQGGVPGEKVKKYPPVSMTQAIADDQQAGRPSMDSKRSRRSFSLGLGKKRSGSVTGSQTSLDKQNRRFSSLLPNSFSFKAIGLGKDYNQQHPESQPNLPMQDPPRAGEYGRYMDQPQAPSSTDLDGMYAQLQDNQQPGPESAANRPQQQQQYQRYSNDPYRQQQRQSAIPSHMMQQGAVLNSASESSQENVQRPANQSAYSLDPSEGKRTQGRRGILQKNKRFVDAYDTDEYSQSQRHDHAGSSGAARRVMDFFRRRGKARGGDER